MVPLLVKLDERVAFNCKSIHGSLCCYFVFVLPISRYGQVYGKLVGRAFFSSEAGLRENRAASKPYLPTFITHFKAFLIRSFRGVPSFSQESQAENLPNNHRTMGTPKKEAWTLADKEEIKATSA